MEDQFDKPGDGPSPPETNSGDDLVDIALNDSFPASDPPAYMGGAIAGGPRRQELHVVASINEYRFYLLDIDGHATLFETVSCDYAALSSRCTDLMQKHPTLSAVEVWHLNQRVIISRRDGSSDSLKYPVPAKKGDQGERGN